MGDASRLAGAQGLRPRTRVELMGSAKLEDITPQKFGSWQEIHVGDVIQPRTEGSLAAELYSPMIGRVYVNTGGNYVMLSHCLWRHAKRCPSAAPTGDLLPGVRFRDFRIQNREH